MGERASRPPPNRPILKLSDKLQPAVCEELEISERGCSISLSARGLSDRLGPVARLDGGQSRGSGCTSAASARMRRSDILLSLVRAVLLKCGIMSAKISPLSSVQLGVVPTHIKFVGGLVPDEVGKFPRGASGALAIVETMRHLCEQAPFRPQCVQIPFFSSADPAEVDELVRELRALKLEVHFIIMVGGANPMNPADEDATVAQLVTSLKAAVAHGIRHVSSTSIEEWMSAKEGRRDGAAFDAAVAQNVRVHQRVYREAGLEGSCVENWHIEFLRPGEFKTFTDVARGWSVVHAANKALGKKFFKLLVDAAHCGDSGLSIEQNAALIAKIAAEGELGIFHASAKTTRGCLSTDDGWIGALLTEAARTGCLEHVFVEVFHHEDPALEALRKMDSRHGVNTCDGRSYEQLVEAALADVAHRLNNLVVRGILRK